MLRQRIFQQDFIFKFIKARGQFCDKLEKIYTYTSVKEIIVLKVQKYYEYEVAGSLGGIE